MKIMITLSCVDGTEETIQTTEPHRAEYFLVNRDHEGSTLGAIIELDNSDEVYNVIRFLKEEEERRKRNS